MKPQLHPPKFEDGLIEALQPIRQFVLAASLFHLFDTGIYDLIAGEAMPVVRLTERLGLDGDRTRGFLSYLKNEGIVALSDDVVSLTERGRAYSEYRAWYTMLIGGYGGTFMQIGESMPANAKWASRDIVNVGVGSCGISRHDAFPLTKSLIAHMDEQPQLICDLGCGNGMYMVEFCKYFPELNAIGVEPDRVSCDTAQAYVDERELGHRIRIVCDSATEFVKHPGENHPDLYILGFVLHEILGQQGEAAVVEFLSLIREKNPDTHLIIIEVDNRIHDQARMKHGLAEAYYNPYYLLHYFTNQKLESMSFWESLFTKAGYEVIARQTTPADVDSTELEIGYLIRGCSPRSPAGEGLARSGYVSYDG